MRPHVGIIVWLLITVGGCSGDAGVGPDQATEAQVTADGQWRVMYGPEYRSGGGEIKTGTGTSRPFAIGVGRQCARVSMMSGTSVTLRIGRDGHMTVMPWSTPLATYPSGTVCGEGALR